ncbi:nucleolar protein 9 isoform 2-T2 [Spheniscus humboldti]
MLGKRRVSSAMGVRRGDRDRDRAGLEPDAAGYFRRALETLQEGLSPEELALFAPNVLAEAVAAGLGVALDPGGSRVLQALLPRAPLGVLGRVLPPLVAGGLGGPAGHPLGARVLEAALGRVLPVLGEAVGQAEEEAVGQVEEAVGQLAAAVRSDPVAFARHPAGSFVVRALLRVLGGAPGAGVAQLPPGGVEPKAKGVELTLKGAEAAAEGAELPPSFPPLLGQLAEAFEEHLASLLSPAGASLCLQVALEVLHRSQSPACSRLCDALIGQLAPPSLSPAERLLAAGSHGSDAWPAWGSWPGSAPSGAGTRMRRGRSQSPRWAPSPSMAPSSSSTCCTSGTRGWSWGAWRRCPPQRWPPWPAAPPAAGFGTPSWPPPPSPPAPAAASSASSRVTSSRWPVTATAAASSTPSGPRPPSPPAPPLLMSWRPSARPCSATPTAGGWPAPSPSTSSAAAAACGSGYKRPPTAAGASWDPSWRTDTPPGGVERCPR